VAHLHIRHIGALCVDVLIQPAPGLVLRTVDGLPANFCHDPVMEAFQFSIEWTTS
jgi:hypothetical protein